MPCRLYLCLLLPLFSNLAYAEDLIANLPPDPGEAGKATLEGIDSDNDGVRDDVQRWIVMNYPNSEKTRAGLRQLSQDYQRFILGAADPVQIYDAASLMSNTHNCLSYIDFRQAYSWGAIKSPNAEHLCQIEGIPTSRSSPEWQNV